MTEIPPAPDVNFPPSVAARRAALVREYAHHEEKSSEHGALAIRCVVLVAEIDATVVACAKQISDAVGEKLAVASTKTWSTERQPRVRRDVRGMVLEALCGGAVSISALAERLSITRRQAEIALTYHGARELNGHWLLPDALPASAIPGPPSLLDVIRAAGETGVTDEELAAKGYPYVAIIKAKNAGQVQLRDGRIYLAEEKPEAAE